MGDRANVPPTVFPVHIHSKGYMDCGDRQPTLTASAFMEALMHPWAIAIRVPDNGSKIQNLKSKMVAVFIFNRLA
ncbi:MAG: hypothetical protein AB4042_11680 [Leptolyngbyaceae cyanobacterium]